MAEDFKGKFDNKMKKTEYKETTNPGEFNFAKTVQGKKGALINSALTTNASYHKTAATFAEYKDKMQACIDQCDLESSIFISKTNQGTGNAVFAFK